VATVGTVRPYVPRRTPIPISIANGRQWVSCPLRPEMLLAKGVRWYAGSSVCIGYGLIACYLGKYVPMVVALNGLHYHILRPTSTTAFVADVGYNVVAAVYHICLRGSWNTLLFAVVGAFGWWFERAYLGLPAFGGRIVIGSELWHVLTVQLPCAGMLGSCELVF
jgi:hypothetical protein